MASLILIRHSITRQQPDISSHEWTLTEEGRVRCKILAEQLRPYDIDRMFSSHETKARLTAALTAAELNLAAPEILPGVEETHRHTAPFVKTAEEFQAQIRAAMQQPDKLLYGEETFTAARTRFSQAVDTAIQTNPGKTLAVVTHGTIMSLYMAAMTRQDVFDIWQSLDMPAYAVFSMPKMSLVKFVRTLASG